MELSRTSFVPNKWESYLITIPLFIQPDDLTFVSRAAALIHAVTFQRQRFPRLLPPFARIVADDLIGSVQHHAQLGNRQQATLLSSSLDQARQAFLIALFGDGGPLARQDDFLVGTLAGLRG
jgi:hypothetical protein